MYAEGLREQAAKIWDDSIRSVGFIEANSSHGYPQEYMTKLESMKFLANLNLAQYYIEERKWGQAERHARAALKIDEDSLKGLYRLVVALMEQERFAECKKILGIASNKHPLEHCIPILRDRVTLKQRDKSQREKKLWFNRLSRSTASSDEAVNWPFSCCRRRRRT